MSLMKSRIIVGQNGHQFFADSFDRFGDDLCQHLLAYLSFEDKTRLQYVSKQWNRLVFNTIVDGKDIVRQVVSDGTDGQRRVDINLLKSWLQKCPNIATIDLTDVSLDDLLLDVITECCPRLESITADTKQVSTEAITRFGQRVGHRIKSIRFTDCYEDNQKLLLTFCPIIESLQCDHQLFRQIIGSKPLKNLKKLYVWVEKDVTELGEQFFGHLLEFTPNLKCLGLEDKSFQCRIALHSIPRPLMSLQKFHTPSFSMDNSFLTHLDKLAPNLRSVQLVGPFDPPSDQLLSSLSRLKSLTELMVNNWCNANTVTDSGLSYLTDGCPLLRKVYFHFAPDITAESVNKWTEMATKRPKEKFTLELYTRPYKRLAVNNVPANLNIVQLTLATCTSPPPLPTTIG